ncbi:MAG TPA: nucleotide exchange factor GrpE [Acidobacteriaceae bacterium]|nr:nucleotide exchange factor GrpE [Acidobacteriaceae bacterium]
MMASARKITEPVNEEQLNGEPVESLIDPGPAVERREGTQAGSGEGPANSQSEIDRLKAERDQLVDRLARLQAEFENARKRESRERADFRDFAVSGAVEQFLPVLDNFQRALGSSGSVDQLRTGIELIVKQMEDVLRALNVTPVETVGTKFDPRIHEALESVDRNDLPDHQVLDEVRRGYRIRERLLRPALVRVVNNPQQKEA